MSDIKLSNIVDDYRSRFIMKTKLRTRYSFNICFKIFSVLISFHMQQIFEKAGR
jgi:hypothetical protein